MTSAAIVIAISFVACISDLRTRRIPNVLTLGSALVALVVATFTRGAPGLLDAAGGWLVATVIFFGPFALGGLGGGDVKLLGALGAWLGPEGAVWLSLYTGACGGVLALAVALRAHYLRRALSNIWLLLSHWTVRGIGPVSEVSLAGSASPRLAYGVAIFAGALVTLWLE